MGAKCSSTARSRFESIRTLVMRKACLTSYTADGLLPRGKHGPLIWMFGEDHLGNEAVKHASDVRKLNNDERQRTRGKNCLLLLDVAKEAASNCEGSEKAGADVIFLYENAVIDAEKFPWADPNEWQEGNRTGLIATRHALKPMVSTKNMVRSRPMINASPNRPDPSEPPSIETMPKSLDSLGRVRLANDNVRPVPMDVFHRIRSFVMTGQREGAFAPMVAVQELLGFWESVGYNAPDLMAICREAVGLADHHSVHFASQGLDEGTRASVYEALVGVSLAKLSFEQNVPPDDEYVWHTGKKEALKELDTYVAALFQDPGEYSPSINIPTRLFFDKNIAQSMGIRFATDRDYRAFAIGQLAFQLLGICGDVIVFEYLSSLAVSKQDSTIVLMNAGHQHVNRIRRWLLAGQYEVAHERLSDDAHQDEDFVKSRW